ncbi:DNA polymerase Y family protein [Actinospica robiniae]|uniref:DNA polymerase Y family protein n=1 Tax=Actinospica robiniae TaxID=304901 RepID=UPI000406D398|nr:DNA polymerase Y family protein [Actinospica robiniae]
MNTTIDIDDPGSPARVLAAWAPAFTVLAAGAALDELAATVAAGRVTAVTPAAARAGVRVGMRARDAHRICPQLAAYRADSERAARVFEPVVCALEEVAAGVEVVRPGLCVLLAAGPVGYYGGEEQAAGVIRDAAAVVECELGPVAVGVGVADGMAAAVLAARTDTLVPPGGSRRFLAEFDIAALADAQLAQQLRRLGIRRVGQFAALPASSVATRFGLVGLRAHRLARGLDARDPAPRRAPRELSVVREFEPVPTVEPLVFAARGLAEQLHEKLAGLGLVCDRVEIEALTGDGRGSARWWRHEGRLSARAVAERVRWQLEAWAQRNPPPAGHDPHVESGEGFVSLSLRPDGLRIATGTQIDLLGGVAQLPETAEAAIERLQDLLGHTRVARPVLSGGRGVGEQIALVPFGDLDPESRGTGPWPGRVPEPAPAMIPGRSTPVRLLDAAGNTVVVTARGEMPDPPAVLEVGAVCADVTGYSQPWPVHERPWDEDGGRRYARLQVTTADGHAYLLAAEAGSWYVLAGYQ